MGAGQDDFLRRRSQNQIRPDAAPNETPNEEMSLGALLGQIASNVRLAVDPREKRGLWNAPGFVKDVAQEAQRRPLTTLTPWGAPEGYRAGSQMVEDGHPFLGRGVQALSLLDGVAGAVGVGALARPGIRAASQALRGMGRAGHLLPPGADDWGFLLPRPPEELSGRMVSGHHYSQKISDPTITHLDPSMAGTGQGGAEMMRDRRATNVYFPKRGEAVPVEPESRFAGYPRYDLEFPEELILTDPEDIRQFTAEARSLLWAGAADGYMGDVVEDLMEEAGYRGWASGGSGRIFGHTELPGRFNEDVFRKVMRPAEEGGQGITIDPRTGRDLGGEDLYSVAIRDGDDWTVDGELRPEHIAEFRELFAEDLAKPDHQLGIWHDEGKDKWIFDVAETHADRGAAEAAGRERGQDAIFHLGTFETIPLNAPAAPAANQAGRAFFDPAAVANVEEAAAQYKSRDRVIDMPIQDFLDMAEGGNSPSKLSNVEGLLDAGTPFNSIPHLGFEIGEDGARVTSHEGRHRARALQARGVETMPVVLRGPIRWDQQSGGPDQFQGEWPSVLRGQDQGEIPFPVQDLRRPPDFMDPAARAQRAVEQGFTTPAFHGTDGPLDFQEFNPWSHFGTPQAADDRLKSFGSLISPRAPRTLPMLLRGNFLETRDFAESPIDIWNYAVNEGYPLGPLPPELQDYAVTAAEEHAQRAVVQKALEPHGITGTRYRNQVEDAGSNSYMVFDPKNARSRVAAFDPNRWHSRNILAGLTGLLGAGTVLRPEGGGR